MTPRIEPMFGRVRVFLEDVDREGHIHDLFDAEAEQLAKLLNAHFARRNRERHAIREFME